MLGSKFENRPPSRYLLTRNCSLFFCLLLELMEGFFFLSFEVTLVKKKTMHKKKKNVTFHELCIIGNGKLSSFTQMTVKPVLSIPRKCRNPNCGKKCLVIYVYNNYQENVLKNYCLSQRHVTGNACPLLLLTVKQ